MGLLRNKQAQGELKSRMRAVVQRVTEADVVVFEPDLDLDIAIEEDRYNILDPVSVEEGEFQAQMLVRLQNDGPVTILIDSRKTF